MTTTRSTVNLQRQFVIYTETPLALPTFLCARDAPHPCYWQRAQQRAARRGTALRGLDRRLRMGEDGVVEVGWSGGLGTNGPEKQRGNPSRSRSWTCPG